MPSRRLHIAHALSGFASLALGGLLVAVVVTAVQTNSTATEAYIVRNRLTEIPWKSYDMEDVERGFTAPADTHVVFHMPFTFDRLPREVVLGRKGKDVRYWGYCFKQNYEDDITDRRQGLKGQLFLSEKEQAIKREALIRKKPAFSLSNLPTKEELNAPPPARGIIRHQLNYFTPGMLCYLMTEASLSVGTDPDDDGLNTALEGELGTETDTPDTDADGVWDGIEYLHGLNPVLRDTDSDNIIDGIEDKNWDGDIDAGETDPREKDTDRDGLCDGLCRVRLGRGQEVFMGEDANLNGEPDPKETDPLNPDTDNDRASDEVEFMNCLSSGKKDCIGSGGI